MATVCAPDWLIALGIAALAGPAALGLRWRNRPGTVQPPTETPDTAAEALAAARREVVDENGDRDR